jgi:hypothetical protein
MIDVFISHSSQDKKLAEALIAFLRDALSLIPERFRCTSVEPYGLRGGAHTESELRSEVVEAKRFLALITPTSVLSPWVLIELGARWASKKPLTPLLAKGATPNSLKGPIALLTALRCDELGMQKLVHEMAKEFDVDVPQPSVYRERLNQLISFAKPASSVSPELLRAVQAAMQSPK